MQFDFTVLVPYAVFSVEYVSVYNVCGHFVLE
jgi:hypothetical protein